MEPNQDPRLDEIIDRLARLERFVGLPRAEQAKSRTHAPKPAAPVSDPSAPPPLLAIEHQPDADLGANPTAPAIATSQGPLAYSGAAEAIARGETPGPSESRLAPRDLTDLAHAASARVRERLQERAATGVKKSMADVERLIGGRWYAVVGAVVLVIGVGMGLKWAYDAGLLRLPPALRCLSGGVFGALLIGAGYWLRKRVNDWAAVGATAAGLGSMYVSVLAAYKLFAILPPAAGFAMLAGVSLLGIVISVQSRLAAVAIISLIAGYITPLMFLDVQSSPLRFALYLLMLLTTGLGVSAWRGRAFASLRTLAWSGTLVWGTVWTLSSARDELWLAISFLAAVWCLLHAELLWSAKNAQLALPVAEDPDAPPSEPTPRSIRFSRWSTWRPVTISISATFWGVTLGCTVLSANLWPTWPAPAAALLACGAIWLLTAFHLDLIRQCPTSDLEVLGVVAAIQIGGLLLTTIALAFGGPTQVVTWLLLAVAAAAASTRLGARAIFYYALIPAVIATLRLVLWDAWRGGWHTGGYHVVGLQFTPWTLLMLGAGASWIVLALLRPLEPARRMPPAMAVIAMILFMLAGVHPASAYESLFGWWFLWALAPGIARSRPPRLRLIYATVIGAVLCAGLWAVLFLPDWTRHTAPLLLQPGLITGFALAAQWSLVARWLRTDQLAASAWRSAIAAALVVFFLSTSLEAARVVQRVSDDPAARGAGVSLWWGVFAAALLIAGFWRRSSPFRWGGLVLLGVTSLKLVIIDMASVPMLWRTISFLALGLLMIAVPVAYARLAKREEADAPDPGESPPTPDSESAGPSSGPSRARDVQDSNNRDQPPPSS